MAGVRFQPQSRELYERYHPTHINGVPTGNAPYESHERLIKNANRTGFDWRFAAPVAGIAALPALGALVGGIGGIGGGGAASAATTAGATTAGAGTAAAGAGMTFGNLLKLGELGVGVGTNFLANRSQNRQLASDAAMRQNEFAAQMQLAREQQAMAQRQWEAEQAQRAQDYGLAMEDRRLALSDRDRRIRLEDEREARLAPRRAMAQAARMRMMDLLRLGAR